MSSVCANDGSSVIVVSFEVGYDLDIAAVDVQNRAQIAQPQLPSEVQRQGVTVKKQSTDLTLVVNLGSPDGSRDELYLSNYATINIIDESEAHPRRRRHRELRRRATTRCGSGSTPRGCANLGLAAADVVNAVARAERAGRRRPDRPAAGRRAARQFQYTDHHARPADGRPSSSRTSSSARRRRPLVPHPGRRPRGARRAELRPAARA